ncbi:MAG: cytochrome P460 family protein [Bacteriovoracaceae bacterium]
MFVLSFAFFQVFLHNSFAYYEKAIDPNRHSVMNGISFNQFKDFPNKWKLVTVRFRVDSKEIRMIYANTMAWEGLKKMKPSYENGSAFGKVAFYSEADPAFMSSLSPSGVRRFQLMIKDSKKYASTDGWGYALFNEEGGLFKEDMNAKTMACVACHRAVPEREFVFSRPVNLVPGSIQLVNEKNKAHEVVQFVLLKNNKLPRMFKNEMRRSHQDVYSLEGSLKKNAFSGTLDEIIPFLVEKVKQTGTGATLFLNESNFSLVERADESCTNKHELRYRVIIKFNNGLVRNNEFCQ